VLEISDPCQQEGRRLEGAQVPSYWRGEGVSGAGDQIFVSVNRATARYTVCCRHLLLLCALIH